MFGNNNQDGQTDDQDNNQDQTQNLASDDSQVVSGLGTPPAVEPDDSPSSDPIPTDSDQTVTAAASPPDTSNDLLLEENTSTPTPAGDSTNNLIDLKSKALHQLAPLVNHLDQTPEEKFRTTMMMIQASDNQALIQDAYDAAQQIADDKAKAQALLDIVNEINYFTQHQAS